MQWILNTAVKDAKGSSVAAYGRLHCKPLTPPKEIAGSCPAVGSALAIRKRDDLGRFDWHRVHRSEDKRQKPKAENCIPFRFCRRQYSEGVETKRRTRRARESQTRRRRPTERLTLQVPRRFAIRFWRPTGSSEPPRDNLLDSL